MGDPLEAAAGPSSRMGIIVASLHSNGENGECQVPRCQVSLVSGLAWMSRVVWRDVAPVGVGAPKDQRLLSRAESIQ